ncbi:MAG: CDP-glucose 4,6-dehydratase [Beijerinckiaceae bacterium]
MVNPSADFWRGRRVLITGHTGFKGSWLSLWLTRLGAKITGFSLPPNTEPSLYRLAFNEAAEQFADVRDLAALRACLASARPEIVFHLAAQSLVHLSYRDPVATYATNVMGTVHLLEAVRETDSVSAVVIVTSDKCYENREWHWAYRETEPMGGYDPYSNSKGCTELVTSAYRASFFGEGSGRLCRIASARAGNVIGGGDWSADRLVPDIIRSFGKGLPVEIRRPNAIRPWQHVLEPLSGYIRLAELLDSEEGAKFAEAWNFGPRDEDCRPVSHIADRLAAYWGNGASWFLTDRPQPHEAGFLKVDASKARARLGWNSRLGLDDALALTADWYRSQLEGKAAGALTLAQIERYEALGSASS